METPETMEKVENSYLLKCKIMDAINEADFDTETTQNVLDIVAEFVNLNYTPKK